MILPDTVSSTRYVEFDAPVPQEVLPARRALRRRQSSSRTPWAATPPSSPTPRRTSRTAPRSWSSTRWTPASASRIETYAKSHGVPVIDYDRLTLGGSRKYYVSFNNVKRRQADRPGPGQLRRGLARGQAPGHRHARRPDRQQRHAVRRRATTACSSRTVQTSKSYGRRQPGRDVGPADRADRVPGGVHGAPERQRRADPERRERRADHPLPADQGHQAEDLPDHRAGRHADRACRTSSPATSAAPSTSRSTWRRRPRPRWPCTCGPARRRRRRWSTARRRTSTPHVSVPSVLLTPEWVDADEHERHGHQGQLRAGVAAVRGLVRGGLHEVRHLRMRTMDPSTTRRDAARW